MPRKKAVTTATPDTTLATALDTIAALPTSEPGIDLETQASDAGAVLATEIADPRAGKLYSSHELDVLLRLATSLLGQQTYGTHPDAVLSRARDAFCNAEAILPIYRDLADKDA